MGSFVETNSVTILSVAKTVLHVPVESFERFVRLFVSRDYLGNVDSNVLDKLHHALTLASLFGLPHTAPNIAGCYLSTGFSDYIEASCDEPARVDLQDEFQFFGAIEIEGRQGENPPRYLSTIPGHWIVAALVSNDRNPLETRLPVPFSPRPETTVQTKSIPSSS